jgi:hypothetical protein
VSTSREHWEWERLIGNDEWLAVDRRMSVPPRQMDVVRLYVMGFRDPRVIAQRLGLRVSSVNDCLGRNR